MKLNIFFLTVVGMFLLVSVASVQAIGVTYPSFYCDVKAIESVRPVDLGFIPAEGCNNGGGEFNIDQGGAARFDFQIQNVIGDNDVKCTIGYSPRLFKLRTEYIMLDGEVVNADKFLASNSITVPAGTSKTIMGVVYGFESDVEPTLRINWGSLSLEEYDKWDLAVPTYYDITLDVECKPVIEEEGVSTIISIISVPLRGTVTDTNICKIYPTASYCSNTQSPDILSAIIGWIVGWFK